MILKVLFNDKDGEGLD